MPVPEWFFFFFGNEIGFIRFNGFIISSPAIPVVIIYSVGTGACAEHTRTETKCVSHVKRIIILLYTLHRRVVSFSPGIPADLPATGIRFSTTSHRVHAFYHSDFSTRRRFRVSAIFIYFFFFPSGIFLFCRRAGSSRL